ncbi:MAG: hypothetical protein R3B70_06195 [Polyangiaceae bacterium]
MTAARGVSSGRRASIPAAAIALAAIVTGCTAGTEVRAGLANAAVPAHLPLVRACWEKEFEAAGFRGEYRATVSFVVEPNGRIRHAKVKKLASEEGAPERDLAPFRACIEGALDETRLPREDDENGPGFSSSSELAVENYVFAFVDGSSEARAEAARRSENVLIGPRADRCQGLYSHDPPRDEVDLYTEIGEADSAWSLSKEQPDPYARFLQKAYDLRLELLDRLRREVDDPDLPDANRKKLRSAIEEAETRVKAIGAAIGCTPPT